MSDTFPKTTGDQTPVGYKPLPGSGNTAGPDLKSLVFAAMGVALGIMAGTVFADGSWRSYVPGMAHQPVLASTAAKSSTVAVPSSVPSPPAASVAQSITSATGAHAPVPTAPKTSELQASALAGAALAAPGAKPSPDRGVEVSRVEMPAMPLPRPRSASPAIQAAVAVPVRRAVYRDYSSVSNGSARHGARTTSAPTPMDRMMAARSRRAHLRRLHLTRRRRARFRTAVFRYVKPGLARAAPAPEAPPDRFSFTVEGSVTVTNYDPAAGRIQTYEGETFVVDKSNTDNDVSSWVDYPSDLHYTCNETWNCTLVHGGVEVVSARRTR